MALRKAKTLLRWGARVEVVAADPCPSLRALARARRIRLAVRPYRAGEGGDCAGAHLVVAATGDSRLNAVVAADARAAGALVNVVDSPALCDFVFPAVFRRGPLLVAVSTGGACPAFAAAVRDEIADRIGPEYGIVARLLEGVRRRMRREGVPARLRARAMRALARAGLPVVVRRGGASAARAKARRLLAACLGERWR